MMLELNNYSNVIKNAFKEDILSDIHVLNATEKAQLYDIFCHYVPNKERAFIVNKISSCYNIDRNISFLLETGLEIIFAAYYLRDDIIDDAPLIMGQVNNHISAKHFSLLADILNEIGNIQIAKYCTITGPSLNSFIFDGFLSLNCGQKQGIGSYLINSEQYIDIAYNKNGAMMENTIKMMLPYLPNSDCNVLIEFASSFGVASQIRNDIEDLIKNDEQTLFQDIRTRQVNFVLIEHFCRTGKDIYKEISISDFSDNLYNILFEDICFAIKFLYAFRNNMIKNLNTLQNAQCKEILKDITNSIISFK